MGPATAVDLSDFDIYDDIKHLIPLDFVSGDICFSVNWIDVNGTKYVPGNVLFLKLMDSFSKPVFGRLEEILCSDEKVLFVFSYFVNLGFNSHVHSYHVIPTSPLRYSVIEPRHLFDPMPLHAHSMANGELYVPLKYMY